jgi:hypothetical protein
MERAEENWQARRRRLPVAPHPAGDVHHYKSRDDDERCSSLSSIGASLLEALLIIHHSSGTNHLKKNQHEHHQQTKIWGESSILALEHTAVQKGRRDVTTADK